MSGKNKEWPPTQKNNISKNTTEKIKETSETVKDLKEEKPEVLERDFKNSVNNKEIQKARSLKLKEINKDIKIPQEVEKKEGLGEVLKKTPKEIFLKMTGIKTFFSWKEYNSLKKEKGSDLESGENVADLIEAIRNKSKLSKEYLKNEIRELKQIDPKKYQKVVKLLWENRNKKENLKVEIQDQIEKKYTKELKEKKIELTKESINSALIAAGILTAGATAYGTVIARTLSNLSYDFAIKNVGADGKINFSLKNMKENWQASSTVGKISEVARYAGLGWMLGYGINLSQSGNIDEFKTILSKLTDVSIEKVNEMFASNVQTETVSSELGNINENGADLLGEEKIAIEDEPPRPPKEVIPEETLETSVIPENLEIKVTETVTKPEIIETVQNEIMSKGLEPYIVKSGDGLWKILRDDLIKGNLSEQLQQSGIGAENFGENSTLTDAQVENMVGNLMLKIQNDPETFGFESGFNPREDGLKAGDKINFNALAGKDGLGATLTDYSGKEHQSIVERATELTEKDIDNINTYEEKPISQDVRKDTSKIPIQYVDLTNQEKTASDIPTQYVNPEDIVNLNNEVSSTEASFGTHLSSDNQNNLGVNNLNEKAPIQITEDYSIKDSLITESRKTPTLEFSEQIKFDNLKTGELAEKMGLENFSANNTFAREGKIITEINGVKVPENILGEVYSEYLVDKNAVENITFERILTPEQIRLEAITSGEIRPDTFQFLQAGEEIIDEGLKMTVERTLNGDLLFTKNDLSMILNEKKDALGNIVGYVVVPSEDIMQEVKNNISADNSMTGQKLTAKLMAQPENNFLSSPQGLEDAFKRIRELFSKREMDEFWEDMDT